MSESTRRRRYRYDRVVIESSRILNPSFDDGVLFFTGAQIELMRNMTEYLRRLETYTTEYHLGYYLTPDVEDYDALMAIVADLEETLMGNPNTIWGYKETYRDANHWGDADPGTNYLNTDAIPAGSVARLEGFAFQNDATVLTRVVVKLKSDAVDYPLLDIANPAAGVWHIYDADRTMEAGDYLEFEMVGCVQDDGVSWQMVGRLMDVP